MAKKKTSRKPSDGKVKRGRPPGRDRTIQLALRVNAPEHAAIESAASKAQQTVGVWLRGVALAATGYVPAASGDSSDG